MKTKTIVIIIFCGLALFASRNYIKDLSLTFLDDDKVVSDDYTQDQQSAIDDFKNGASNVFSLLKDNLFSLDELSDLKILDNKNPLQSLGELIDNDKSFSMSDINIDSLNLNDVSDEQLSTLMKVISGDMTMSQLVISGEFTMEDLQNMGLFDVIMDNIGKDSDED